MPRWKDALVREFCNQGNETAELVGLIEDMPVSFVIMAMQEIKSEKGTQFLIENEGKPIYELFVLHADAILASQVK